MPHSFDRFVPAYYAQYKEGHHGARDRIGGLPLHLPAPYPTCSVCGKRLGLLMQLYVDDKELFPDDWLALQLYECAEEGCCMEGDSRLIVLPTGAAENTGNAGLAVPDAEPRDISWIKRDDPDPSLSPDDIGFFWDENSEPFPGWTHLDDDKLGGCFAWEDEFSGATGYRVGAVGQFGTSVDDANRLYLYIPPEGDPHFSYY
jgi:hypothetical protein